MASSKKPAKKPVKKLKIKLGYYIRNQGDGSAAICLFNSEKDADKYAEPDDERFCEDTGTLEIIVDEKGRLLNPDKRDD